MKLRIIETARGPTIDFVYENDDLKLSEAVHFEVSFGNINIHREDRWQKNYVHYADYNNFEGVLMISGYGTFRFIEKLKDIYHICHDSETSSEARTKAKNLYPQEVE
jgi:hypothetical protein